MPKLITRKKNSATVQAEPCNFIDPSQNAFVEQQVPLDEFKARCARYYDYLAALQPPQENTMIRAANFTTDAVLRLLQQNPASAFIRVYYGIDANGEHGLFMAPVPEETAATAAGGTDLPAAGTATSEEAAADELLYVDDCCVCPPRLNCPRDGLLAWPS